MKRRCIISYASNGREYYPEGLKRLVPSIIKTGYGRSQDTAFILMSPDIDVEKIEGLKVNRKHPPGFPTHQEVPYGFKPWLFKKAFEFGFEQVLWCDATIIVRQPLNLIWDVAGAVGATLFDNPGCPMRVWSSDDCMDAIGCPYQEPQQAMFNEIMACAMAIDYSHPRGKAAFDEWFAACNDGVSFAGIGGSKRLEFRGHRHDQSVMSWLAHKYAIPRFSYGTLVYHPDREKFPNHILANTGLHEVPV